MQTETIAIPLFVTSLCFTLPCVSFADAECKGKIVAPPSKVSLLVAEGLPGSHVADPQILVRYRFENGIRVAREEVLKTSNSQVRYDLGDNMTYLPQEWHKLGHGFDVEKCQLPQAACTIRYQGKEIGRDQVDTACAKTIQGHFAAVYTSAGRNLGEPAGVRVWSSLNGEWTTIELDWAVIIGWIDDTITGDISAKQEKQESNQPSEAAPKPGDPQ